MPQFSSYKEQEFEEDYYVEYGEIFDSQNLGFRNPGLYDSEDSVSDFQENLELTTNNNNLNNTNYINYDDVSTRGKVLDIIYASSSLNQLDLL